MTPISLHNRILYRMFPLLDPRVDRILRRAPIRCIDHSKIKISLEPSHAHYLNGASSLPLYVPLHSATPATSLISSSLFPSFTTLCLNNLGSRPIVLRRVCWARAELSKRMIKCWPVWCLKPFLRHGLGSRNVPQLVMPRTTPPLSRMIFPAVFAILI